VSALRILVCEDLPVWTAILPQRYEDEVGTAHFTVCRTVAELLASVEDGWDAILIDDLVPAVSGALPQPNAVAAVADLTRISGREGPVRIYWTQPPDPTSIYAFIAYGGHAFLNKAKAVSPKAIVDEVRSVVGGRRWVETPQPLENPEDERLLRRWRRMLALLDAGFRADQIAERLHTTPAVVTTTAGKLAKALSVERGDGVFQTLIPQAAKGHGYFWVPYRFWDLAPDDSLWPGELSSIRRPRS
jgi:DNA-binding NarL/FixJ family response regulator